MADRNDSCEPKMPIYEFYCRRCHRVYSFLSRAVDTDKTPPCPRCESAEMTRRASAFAISKGRKEEPKPEVPPGPDVDEARLERAMEAMAGELESIDENDPKQGARLMRKLFSATGMPVGTGMEEALRRMEAGEDPERIEEQMGDVFEGDPFGGLLGGEAGEKPTADEARTAARFRRLLPPSHDPELYEMP
jgi:putative FmdB family regulatory protein